MSRSLLLPLLLAAAALVCVATVPAVVHAASAPAPAADPTSAVQVLTDLDFDARTASGSWLLEFYAPWCGHCKTLAPLYEEAARTLRDSPITLAKIDATVATALAARFNIRGFPSLKFFREGEMRNYNGPRTVAGMVEFGKQMCTAPVQTLSSAKEYRELTSKHPVSLVFLGKQGVERRLFETMAYRLQGTMHFLRVVDSPAAAAAAAAGAAAGSAAAPAVNEVYAAAGVSPEDTPLLLLVTAHADPADAANRYAGPWSEASLRDYIVGNRLPLISELDQSNFDEVTASGSDKRVVYAVIDAGVSSGLGASKKAGVMSASSRAFVDALYPLAKQPLFREHFIFATIDGRKYNKYVSQFGVPLSGDSPAEVDVSALPTVVVLDRELDYFYAPEPRGAQGAVHPIGDAEAVRALLSGILSGSVSLQGTTPWYNPARYVKLLEKALSSWPVWQVAVLATAIMLAIVVGLFYCCFSGLDGEEGEEVAAAAAAVALAEKRDGQAAAASAAAGSSSANKAGGKDAEGMRSRKGGKAQAAAE